MFTKILIANRGEIACRVAATARRMGVQTVAVYSEADANARHVMACDESICIGPAPAQESYLCAGKIIDAALATGAQAVHPGYGFLSENPDFATACAKAGLTFIGPPATAMRAMGSKSAAKSLMEKAQVPLVPGYHGDNQAPAFLQQQAARIGYPVLIKASAGGGGKGMRIVEQSADFHAALASCKREAVNSFGDDTVLVEKYLTQPRHIEMQVFADMQGHCIHLFERDCSVQRRHQKVLEEAPAPGMTSARRQAMGAAAVAAAQTVGYVGAGTVEFIVEGDAFYFMEMNTRLQVEHPVTEMITGLDLVEWQLRIAAGEPLPLAQQAVAMQGHAIEARIYAENPEKGFLPSIGTLQHVHMPDAVAFEVGRDAMPAATTQPSAGVIRVDSGVREGDAISPFYDPMIAKLIVWDKDRAAALARMAEALAQCRIVGLATNIAFLKRLVSSPPFVSAALDTGLIERHHTSLFPPAAATPPRMLVLAGMWLILLEQKKAMAMAHEPWAQANGWRMNSRLQRTFCFTDRFSEENSAEKNVGEVTICYRQDGWLAICGATALPVSVIEHHAQELVLKLGDEHVHGTLVQAGEVLHLFVGGEHAALACCDPLQTAGQAEAEGGRLTAPMPGKIVALLVAQGAQVEKGTPLLVMEAMKMEHTIAAPASGVVEEMLYAIGDQVAEGAQLLSFKPRSKGE